MTSKTLTLLVLTHSRRARIMICAELHGA
jgi:hypothetical protein